MKKNILQKVLVFALTGAMAMGMLSGCGNTGADSSDTTQTQPATDSTATTDNSAATDNTAAADTTTDTAEEPTEDAAAAAGVEGYEAFADNVTLKVAVYDRGVEGVPTVNDNYWTKWVQENFGDRKSTRLNSSHQQ